MGFSFFHTPKPRNFNYVPRYFDPDKEALEKKKAAMGLDSKLSEHEKLRIKIRKSYGYVPEEYNERKNVFGYKKLRYIVIMGLLIFFVYIIFGTPMLENFFKMFLSMNK